MNRIKNLFLGDPAKKKRKQTFKFYLENISLSNYNFKSLYVLIYFMNRFDHMNRHGLKNNKSSYEFAILNQTVEISMDQLFHIDANRTRLKDIIDKMVADGIIKRLDKSKYLINPLYSDNLGSKQVKYANDIMSKEFGV